MSLVNGQLGSALVLVWQFIDQVKSGYTFFYCSLQDQALG